MSRDDEQQIATRVERRDGRLHSIQEVRDNTGRLLSQLAKPLQVELHGNDIAQLVAGACALAIPVAFTEEVWVLGATLSSGRILLAVAMVLLILIEKGPFDDLQLALRRAVLIAFPASFAATAVDYIK